MPSGIKNQVGKYRTTSLQKFINKTREVKNKKTSHIEN